MLIRFASIIGLLFLTACSLLEPKPEIVDQGPKEQPLPPALVENYNLGLELLADDDQDAAAAHWLQLTEQYPEYPGNWANLAIIQYRQEQYDGSLASLVRSLEIKPDFCPSFKLKGLVERELGKFTEAEVSYLAAINCAPEDADVRYNLGILYDLYLNDLPKALEQYQLAQSMLAEEDENMAIWIPDLQRRSGVDKPAEAQIAEEG